MGTSENRSFVSTKNTIEPPEPHKFPHKQSEKTCRNCEFERDVFCVYPCKRNPIKTESTINKFKGFTDDELYVLHRVFIESSFEFFMSERYVDGERHHHKAMCSAVADEIKRRKK